MAKAPGPRSANDGAGLTVRQQKWFASVRASLERDTGKTLEEWVAIARTSPETKHRARIQWLKAHHGLGINRASQVLSAAFPSSDGWDNPDEARAKLWADPASLTILAAVEAAATILPGVVVGQRKSFTAFSRNVQFAALRPVKGGTAMLGLALSADASPLLQAPKNESWSERLKGRLPLATAADVNGVIEGLLREAWERS